MMGKKSLFLCCGLALNVGAFAHTAATNNFISLPNLKPGFEFNVAALWLKPGASNLNYVIYNKELPAQTPNWEEKEIQPSYNAGFELGLRYIFPNATSQDILLTWTHVNTSDSDTTTAPDASFFLGPDYEIGPAGIPIRYAKGKANFDYNVVNLDVGQYANFGQRLMMRFFAGLSGANLKEKVTPFYSGTTTIAPIGPFTLTQSVSSTFTGIGPRFGVSANYDTCFYGIGVTGEAAASLLIGYLHSHTNFTSTSVILEDAFDQSINYQYIKDQNVYQVIPGLDAKLGLNYKHMFNDMMLMISAGYQAAVYVNAISQYLPASLVTPFEVGGIYVATMSHTLSNYSVQGPYLDFALKF